MKRFLLLFFSIVSAGLVSSFAQNPKVLCTPPTVTMSSNVTICAGETVTISSVGSATSAPYTYDWTPVAGVSCPSGPGCSTTSVTPGGTTTYTCLVTDNLSCTATGTVLVTVNTLPSVGISGAGSICPGTSATLTGTGGSTYSWNTTATTTSITVSPTTATTYTVWGTDANNCSNTATGTVSLYTAPTASISGTAAICGGDNVTLTGSGGIDYSWAPGSQTTTSIVVAPTVTTNYTLTVTDGNGCTDTDVSTITVNGTPTITVTGSTTVCSAGSVTLCASGADTYGWSTGSSSTCITVNPTVATTYTVTGTITATGCSAQSTGTVSIYPSPTASITGNMTICAGQGITLTGSGGTSYSWSTTSTNNPINDQPTATTSYTVIATDGNGCTDDTSVTVVVNPLPTAYAGPDVSICSGSSTTLNATGNGTYNWSPSTGLSSTTDANPTASPTVTTSYTVTVTNSCGSIDDSVTVTINTLPSVSAGADDTICPSGSTTLNASGSGTYAWSPATGLSSTTIANPVANPTVSTNYTVTITDICGTASDSVWVILDAPTASISGTNPICNGTSSTLCATGGGTYAWNTSATTSCITVSPTSSTGYTVTTTDSFGCTATDTMTVSVNALPTATITGSDTICSGINDTLVATGGTGYVWDTGSTNDSLIVSPSSGTTYTVTITDANGCTDVATFALTVNPLPTASAGTDATICAGGNTTLNGSGNGTYVWTPVGTVSNPNLSNPIATPTSTTTYTVAVSNSCGTAFDSVQVVVNQLPAVNITGNDTICMGSSDTLIATGGGTYSWNTSSTNDSIFVNPATTTGYTVTVTDANNCSNSATFTVNISSVTAGITGTNAICSGQSATLTASGGGTYVWNTAATATSILVSPTINTTYTVTATNALGCTDTATFSVNVTAQPTASVTATSTSICTGSATTLTASGGTNYTWSPTTGLTNSTIANPVSTTTTNITYTVIVSTGTCSDTTSIAVTVSSNPTVTVTASSSAICVGGCDTLSASGGTTYVWAPGGQTTSAIIDCPTSATTYTVTTTDANGCTDNTTATVNVLPPVSLLTSGDTTLCPGDGTLLTAQGASSYSWSTGATTSAINVAPTSSTTYTVSASNGACSDTATINVNVNPAPAANASASPYTINIGGQTTLVGTTSTGTYNWSPSSGLSCAQCPNPVVSPTATTTYTLCITDANQCSVCDTVVVNVDMICGDLFVPSAFSPNNDGHNDILYVRSPCIKTIEFTIYNRWGQIIFFSDDIAKGWDGTFHGKDADAAVFFYILNVTLFDDKFINKEGNFTLVR